MAEFISFIFSLTIAALQTQLFSGQARKVTITNNCTYTVWPVLSSPYTQNGTNFSLQKRESMVVELDTTWWGQLWARTNCTNSTAGKFACHTGDCGSGKADCFGTQAPPATTAVEFTLNGAYGEMYGVSVVHGYNVPVAVVPRGGNGSQCRVTGCVYDIAGACPKKLSLGGACQNPCDAFNNSVYCCDDAVKGCRPFVYSTLFQNACPRAYSYGLDYEATSFVCGGSPAFEVTFCPTSNIVISELSTPFQPQLSLPQPSTVTTERAPPPLLVAPTPAPLALPPRPVYSQAKERRSDG